MLRRKDCAMMFLRIALVTPLLQVDVASPAQEPSSPSSFGYGNRMQFFADAGPEGGETGGGALDQVAQ